MKKHLLVLLALIGIFTSRVDAAPIFFETSLTGAVEFPPNASPGTGAVLVTFDPLVHTMQVEATFADLIGTTTAAHIHCCVDPFGTAGVATQLPSFAGFPLGVTSGGMNTLFDLTLASSFNPAFITSHGGTPAGAEQALLQGLLAGQAYFNIHTSAYAGGEIRGFLTPRQVPEPGTWALLSLGAGAVALARRKRRINQAAVSAH